MFRLKQELLFLYRFLFYPNVRKIIFFSFFKKFFFDKKKIKHNNYIYNFMSIYLPQKKNFFFFLNFFRNNIYCGYNILFVDFKFNYNYLPIDNNLIFSRSLKDLYKFVKLFNINLVFFMDINKKKFIFKKLYRYKLISVSTDKDIFNNIDYNLNIHTTPIINYMLYVVLMDIYLKNKK